MTRILVAECKQEVSSFNPFSSHYADFAICRGEDLFKYHRAVREEIGGALEIFDEQADVTLVPTFGARAITSGGTLAAADFSRLAEEFLNALRAAGPVDAAYFSLHGAMSAEQEDDPEGYLLAESRKILGEKIPIVVSLDLHGILTDRMLEHSDAIVMFHTYPHVDFVETGRRAAKLLMRIVRGEVQPVTAKVEIPALVRGDELITATGSFGECIRAAQKIEQSAAGLSAGMFIGNPFTDVRELRTNSLVVMDGDAVAAEKLAIDMAAMFWSHHEKMQVPLTSIAESIRIANTTPGTTVLMDAADATSSGASGDSNAILRELIADNFSRNALLPIVDPAAVEQALAVGPGATIRTTLGGAFNKRFTPLECEAKVRMLSDGHFRSESFGVHWYSGMTAVLQIGTITVVVASRAVSLYDRAFFLANGQNPQHFDLVVVKSPHCERHMFADWCSRQINVDAPGSTSANLKALGHTKCPRPIFPLDPDVSFVPKAKIFRRG